MPITAITISDGLSNPIQESAHTELLSQHGIRKRFSQPDFRHCPFRLGGTIMIAPVNHLDLSLARSLDAIEKYILKFVPIIWAFYSKVLVG